MAKRKWIAVIGIITGIVLLVLFFALENLRGPVVLANSRTPFFVSGAAVCIVAAVIFLRKKDGD